MQIIGKRPLFDGTYGRLRCAQHLLKLGANLFQGRLPALIHERQFLQIWVHFLGVLVIKALLYLGSALMPLVLLGNSQIGAYLDLPMHILPLSISHILLWFLGWDTWYRALKGNTLEGPGSHWELVVYPCLPDIAGSVCNPEEACLFQKRKVPLTRLASVTFDMRSVQLFCATERVSSTRLHSCVPTTCRCDVRLVICQFSFVVPKGVEASRNQG